MSDHGWGWPPGGRRGDARKHYFPRNDPTRSLCGRWGFSVVRPFFVDVRAALAVRRTDACEACLAKWPEHRRIMLGRFFEPTLALRPKPGIPKPPTQGAYR